MSKENAPPVLVGIAEGLVAPIAELFLAIILTAGIQITESVGGSSSTLTSLFAIIIIADFARNIMIGLLHLQFAIGNIIGNIFGIAIFYSAVNNISHEAAQQSVLLTFVLIVSFAVGVFLTIYSRSKSSGD